MNTLQLKGKDWIYQTAETGKFIKVEIDYSKGELNGRRGLYFHIGPEEIEHGFRTVTLGAGYGIQIAQTPRYNAKDLVRAATFFDPHVLELVKLFESGGRDAVRTRLLELRASFQGVPS